MAMTVNIDIATGAGPSFATAAGGVTWGLLDAADAGANPIPVPTASGTNFSFVKSFQPNITVTDSLSMTDVKAGKTATEATAGTKLWYTTEHASYTQAVAAPASTGDDNVTAPNINSGSAEVAVPLIGAASVYAAGPFSSTGRVGNFVEVCLGVDNTCATAGGAVATPTLEWNWTES